MVDVVAVRKQSGHDEDGMVREIANLREAAAARQEVVKTAAMLCDRYPDYEEFDPLRALLGIPLYRDTVGHIPAPGTNEEGAR